MSTCKIREEFEAWWAATMNLQMLDLYRFCDGYANHETNRGWMAWQASRAALCVELPDVEAWLNDGRLDREPDEDADERMGLVPWIDVRQAIETAGVRVK